MAKIIAASTLALAISFGGAFWGNGAHASTSEARMQTQRWMWELSALADAGDATDDQDAAAEGGAQNSVAEAQ